MRMCMYRMLNGCVKSLKTVNTMEKSGVPDISTFSTDELCDYIVSKIQEHEGIVCAFREHKINGRTLICQSF